MQFNYVLYSKLLLIIFVSLKVVSGQAQDRMAILQPLKKLSSDKEKVSYLETHINEIIRQAPAEALYFAEIADSLLQRIDSLAWKLEIQRLKALAYREMGDYEKATKTLEQISLQISPTDTVASMVAIQARIYINLASLHRRKGDTEQALSLNIQAAQLLDSLVMRFPGHKKYMQNQGLAFSGLGMIHAALDNHKLSNDYFQKALIVHQKLGDRQQIAYMLFNLGSNFYKKEVFDSAEVYWTRGIQYIDTTQQVTLLEAYYYNLGALKTTEKKWEEAIRYYHMAMQLVKKTGNQEELAKAYESLANLYIEKGDYQQAEKVAYTALSLVKDGLATKVRIHADLASIYEKTGQLPKAITYYQKYTLLQDSLTNVEKNRAIAEMEAKYQHDQQQKELKLQSQQIELLSQDNQIKRLTRNMLALAVVLLLLVGFFVVRTQHLRMKRKQEQLEHSRSLLASQQENAMLREQKLRQELEHRNQQLTSYTLNFIQKNELLEELKENVEVLQKQKQWTAQDFRSLKHLIQQHVTIDQDWASFKMHFESVHPDFFVNLNEAFPELGPREMKLCALIRLNLNIKESALVLGISPDSVKTARHRVRKKMNLEQEDNIVEVLLQVEKGHYERAVLLAS